MICVIIKGPTFEEARVQLSKAVGEADLVELRLDFFKSLDINELRKLRSQFSLPMIFALRSRLHGGNYRHSEEERLADIRRLLTLQPEYLDLEHHVPAEIATEIGSGTQLILSYHHFTETPQDLEGIYREMRNIPAFFYKIAVTAKKSSDALRVLCWAKKKGGKLIAISMGSHGEISRIVAPLIGSPITYVSLDDSQTSAPGQIPAKTLIERYHYRSLNPKTALYGLIGSPVTQSISDETHNHLMEACDVDAVYVKLEVSPSELPDFLLYAKQLPFHGMSVTMPLKEEIMPFLDECDPQAKAIGAVNTLLFQEGKLFGTNTDGVGALNAIEQESRVKSKRVVILGAGGAAKAIAYEACRRGALVTILNRNEKKALQIAERLGCGGRGLDQIEACANDGYDILINCTPAQLPIDSTYILPQALVMDITTKPKETEFLQVAREKGCAIIYGYRLFIEQALKQFNLWFKARLELQEGREVLERKTDTILHCPQDYEIKNISTVSSSITGPKALSRSPLYRG